MDTPMALSLCWKSSMTPLAMLTRVVENVVAPSLCTLSRGMPIFTITSSCERITERKSTALAISSTLFGSPTCLWDVSRKMRIGPSCALTNAQASQSAGVRSSMSSISHTKNRAVVGKHLRHSFCGHKLLSHRLRLAHPTCSIKILATDRKSVV